MLIHPVGIAGEGKDKERMQNRTQSRFDSLSGFLKSNGKRWALPGFAVAAPQSGKQTLGEIESAGDCIAS